MLVRAPASLKDALVRETARRGTSLNDVAVGMLADAFVVPYTPTGRRSALAGASPVVLLRMPETLKREIQTEAFRTSTSTNDVIVRTLADGLGIPHDSRSRRSVPFGGGRRKDHSMAESNGSENGSARSKEKVRVAIIGVGNCANSLLQGVEYYKDAKPDETVPGLMHVDLGGYHISDIEFTAAFDVVKGKVGVDLADAIWASPNNTIKFVKEDVPNLGIEVMRGMTHDGLGKYLKEKITKAEGSTVDIAQVLKDTRTDVVVSYLPVGSEQATKWYV